MTERIADAQRGFDACAACGLARGRRAFVLEAAGSIAGALLGLGLSASSAGAMSFVAGRGRRIADSVRYPIPVADQVVVDEEQEVILVRRSNAVYAFALACPHQNTALRWHPDADQFICPKHKSRYRPDGAFIAGRATRNMDRLPVQRDGGEVLVDVSRAYRSDDDAAGWAEAVVLLS